MAKVDIPLFIVAGMPRSGTTFLYHFFQKHPSIWVPSRKETDYFGVNFNKGLSWFLNLYRGIRPDQIGCDISPAYYMDLSTIDRMKSYNPDTKVILAVRNPVETALSLHAHQNTYLWNVPPFEEFIHNYSFPKSGGYYKLEFSRGQFYEGIDSYRKAFGENLLLYNFELFKKDPLLILQYIERFLSLSNYFKENNFKNIIINARNRKNIKLISYLANRESLAKFVEIAIPRIVTLFFRKIFDKISTLNGSGISLDYPPDHFQLATEVLRDDIEYFKKLFRESQIILGNGEPFIK